VSRSRANVVSGRHDCRLLLHSLQQLSQAWCPKGKTIDKLPVDSVQQNPGAAAAPGSARRQNLRSQSSCPPRPDVTASPCAQRSAGTGKHSCCDRYARRAVSVAAECRKTSAETRSVKEQGIFAFSCLFNDDGTRRIRAIRLREAWSDRAFGAFARSVRR
jgi:hypothetical protein